MKILKSKCPFEENIELCKIIKSGSKYEVLINIDCLGTYDVE